MPSRLPLAALLVSLSGCPFFWYPQEPVPSDDDGGGSFVEEDAGLNEDAGVRRGLDRAACTWNGKKLFGRVRYVTSSADVRVKVVTSLPRLRVKRVSSLPNECGEWQEVDSFPDLKVQLVDGLEDFDVEYVDAFPGLN